mgnify:CR=1 FL=1
MLKSMLRTALVATMLASPLSAWAADLVIATKSGPASMDPPFTATAANAEATKHVFDTLLRSGNDLEILPSLATSWEAIDDTTWEFKLRQGVKFHDGSEFTAEDVKFSLDRARAEDSVNAQKVLFSAIDTVEVVDPLTVKVTLKRPQGSFLYNMGWGDAVIVAPESAETNKEKPVGTGPFRFDRWARGASVTLVRNPDYWGEPAALEKAEFRFVPDAAAAVPALLSGDVQAFPNFPASDALEQIKADPRFAVVIGSTEGETILAMNNAKAPFDNLKVRQAISHAIDREEIILGASNGLGQPIGSHFSPANEAYEDLTGLYPHDAEKAKQLLAEAGLADGFSATIKLPPTTYARVGGEIVTSQLAEVDIKLEIIPMEWAQWLEQVFTNKDFDLTIISHTEPNDIDIYGRDGYYFGYNNPEFKTVMAELDATVDPEKRNELYRKAQRIIAEDAVNAFLFQLPKVGVWDAKLVGMWENSPIQANDLTKVRWTD